MAVPKNTWRSTKVSFGHHHKRKISNILLNILQNMISCSYGWRAGTVAEVQYVWLLAFTMMMSSFYLLCFTNQCIWRTDAWWAVLPGIRLYLDCMFSCYDSIPQSNHHFHKRYFERLAGFDYGWPSIPSAQSVLSRSVQCLVCDFSCLYLKSRNDHFSMEFYGMISMLMMRDYFTQHNQLV